jgi:hypothetical protein
MTWHLTKLLKEVASRTSEQRSKRALLAIGSSWIADETASNARRMTDWQIQFVD